MLLALPDVHRVQGQWDGTRVPSPQAKTKQLSKKRMRSRRGRSGFLGAQPSPAHSMLRPVLNAIGSSSSGLCEVNPRFGENIRLRLGVGRLESP